MEKTRYKHFYLNDADHTQIKRSRTIFIQSHNFFEYFIFVILNKH